LRYSDFELIDRILGGNRLAFEELVSRYRTSVYHLTYRMVHDFEDAADLSQETFLKAYQGLKRFKKQSSFHTWLYRISVNLCINHLRKKGNRQYVGLENAQAVRDPEVLEKIAREEVQTLVNNAVSALPEKQRAAVILRVYHGLSHKEISGVLGCSVGTVKANYFHAIRNLRKSLEYHVGAEEDGDHEM
jgi:RNA polymerase sigma-70 factor, ECF subfamily